MNFFFTTPPDSDVVEFFLLNPPNTFELSDEGLLVSLCSLLDVELLLELLLSCEATEWDNFGLAALDEDEDGGGGFAGMLWDF